MTPDPHQDALGSSPVARQLADGFKWLRFMPELELEYRREQYDRQRRQLRINLGIALAIVLAFTQLDRMMLPAGAEPVMNMVRYTVLLPALLVGFVATFLPMGSTSYVQFARVIAPIVMLAIAAQVLIAWSHGDQRLFTALILASIYIYFLIGLPFYAAVFTNALTLVGYTAGGVWSGMPMPDLAYNAAVMLFSNIVGATIMYNVSYTRRRSWLERQLLDEFARRDGLSGIFNRRRFDEHLAATWQQGIREQRPMTLMMVDLDFFKAYNDRYGHQAGDEALKSVAALLSQAARRPLDLAARYGGEEFAVLLYDATREHAAEQSRAILEGVRALRIPHGGSTVAPVLTVSLGVAYVMPAVGRSAEGLLQLADQALYRAKETGRNRVHVLEAEYVQLQTGVFRKDAAP